MGVLGGGFLKDSYPTSWSFRRWVLSRTPVPQVLAIFSPNLSVFVRKVFWKICIEIVTSQEDISEHIPCTSCEQDSLHSSVQFLLLL